MSIDPGSHKMGVAFFNHEGKFLTCTLLNCKNQHDPAAKRLYDIRLEFEQFYAEHFDSAPITVTVIEHLPPSQLTASLPISAGAVVSMPFNYSKLTAQCSVGVSSWKSVAKQLGCEMNDPKGLEIFEQIPWEFPLPRFEDEADAIMMYLTYSFNFKGYAWLGPSLRVRRTDAK